MIVFCQVGDPTKIDFTGKDFSGALIQYPNTYGEVLNPEAFVKKAHEVCHARCLETCVINSAFGVFVSERAVFRVLSSSVLCAACLSVNLMFCLSPNVLCVVMRCVLDRRFYPRGMSVVCCADAHTKRLIKKPHVVCCVCVVSTANRCFHPLPTSVSRVGVFALTR